MVEILKASAGSGKTYTLANKYIQLLLESDDRYAYRHILAVTFTNKATDEMKSRILKELYVMANDNDIPAEKRHAAETVLCNILHDYSAFAVSTIDRFFQQTLKAFSREIGQFASYQVELDRDSLIAESVDRVLDSLSLDKKDEKRLKWLTDNTIAQIESGEGYKLDTTLLNVAARLKSEEHRALVEKEGLDEEILYDEATLSRLAEGCDIVCQDYMKAVKKAVTHVADTFAQAGIDPYDTSSHFMSKTLDRYCLLSDGEFIPCITEAVRKSISDISRWFPKSKSHLMDSVTDEMVDAAAAFAGLFGNEYKAYNTAVMLKGQVYGFGIANDIYKEFNALLREKNVLSLDDSNTILKNIIDGTDTPFIYEKLGVRYEHFLLDEFQDTSRVQWDNFRPLLMNSIAGGFYNLIVGDVKQSIYRFRNSDWKLLRDEVPEVFRDCADEGNLDTNWRSFRNIVAFNNSFFKDSASLLDTMYDGGGNVISSIYEDVIQKPAKENDGAVLVSFCPSDQESEMIVKAVEDAVAHGYSYRDIAVLVRWNKEGAEVAASLMNNRIPVVTDDSLMISSALTVRRLVALLSSMDNPDDSTARYLAGHMDLIIPEYGSSLIDLCEDLLRKLKTYDSDTFSSESLYIQSFMDVVRDFVSVEGSNLHRFLKHWEGNTQSISSPSSGNAVRVMTIHKSKGLDFPYVVVPFLEKVKLSRAERRWCRPEVSGTSLANVAEGIYDVVLSSKSENTLFDGHYRDEKLMQYVDNVNVVYVAFTRAAEVMHVIAELPEEEDAVTDFSRIIYRFVNTAGQDLGMEEIHDKEGTSSSERHFIFGRIPDHKCVPVASDDLMGKLPSSFCSWPLELDSGSEDEELPVNERGRLKFSPDAYEFFSENGLWGGAVSQRIKGIVLHDILSEVFCISDVRTAVRHAVYSGTLDSDEEIYVVSMLEQRLDEVKEMGWFPDDAAQVFNETEVIDSDGCVLRPDRVVIRNGKVSIVDYKFGEHHASYERQLKRYADVWARMGYEDISACLWYVRTGEVKVIC